MTESLTGKQLVEQKRQRFRDADCFKPVDRVPFYAHNSLWQFLDAGFTTDVACRNYDMMKKGQLEFIDKYDPDMVIRCNRNPYPVKDVFGTSDAYQETASGMNAINEEFLLPEDYDEIAKGNFDKVVWEHGVFRKFPNADKFTPEEFAKKSLVLKEWDEGMAMITNAIYEKGVLEINESSYWTILFIENLFNVYRGIKALSMDLRRCPGKVQEACDYMDTLTMDYAIAGLKDDNFVPQYTFDAFSNLLAHTILNRKQFDSLMAKPYGRLLEVCEEKGRTWFNFSEATWKRFGDFFGQYKKGTVAMQVEMDDIYELRKLYPNIALWGGLPVDLLGNGTPEQCVDAAQKAINELGEGFVLMPNKMLSYKYDCRPENLKAVSEYVHTYNA